MKKRSPEVDLVHCLLNPGKTTKIEFTSEEEAKRYFDRLKAVISQLPDFLRPK